MITRTSNGWQYLAVFLVTFHFFVPWLLLLSRDLKRTPHRLVVIAGWILFVRFADIFMLVSPEFDAGGGNLHLLTGEHASHFFVHWLDLAAPLAIGGLWLWMFFTELRQRPLLATGDPYLREALETAGRPLMAHDPHAAHASADDEYLNPAVGIGTRAHRRQRVDDRPVRDRGCWRPPSSCTS